MKFLLLNRLFQNQIRRIQWVAGGSQGVVRVFFLHPKALRLDSFQRHLLLGLFGFQLLQL